MLSARRKKRMEKEALDKQIIWMHRQAELLRYHFKNSGWVKLKKPVKIGYERTFRLKPEILSRPDAAFWEELLVLVNKHIFARRKIYLTRQIRKRAKRRLSKWRWEKKINLRELNQLEYNSLHPDKRKYFYRTVGKCGHVCYRFKKGIYFEEYIRPVYADKIKTENLLLENQWKEVLQLTKTEQHRHRYGWLKGNEGERNDDWYHKPRKKIEAHHDKNLRSIKKYGYTLTNQGCEFRGPDFFRKKRRSVKEFLYNLLVCFQQL